MSKNSKYWQKRYERLMDEQMAKGDLLVGEVEHMYKDSMYRLQVMIKLV